MEESEKSKEPEEVEEAVRKEEKARATLLPQSMTTPMTGTQSFVPTGKKIPIATIAALQMDIGHMNVHSWIRNTKHSSILKLGAQD